MNTRTQTLPGYPYKHLRKIMSTHLEIGEVTTSASLLSDTPPIVIANIFLVWYIYKNATDSTMSKTKPKCKCVPPQRI